VTSHDASPEPSRDDEPPSATRDRGRLGRIAGRPGLLLAAALLAGVAGGGLVLALWWLFQGSESEPQPAAGSCDVERVAERVLPSVVTLQASGPGGLGTGSGVVVRSPVDDEEYVVTNEHVIAPAGRDGVLRVTFFDGRTASGALVGEDAVTDLAVVRVDEPSPEAGPVEVGDSEELVVGQPVVALGAPLGLSSTVTSGIVSATDRYIRVPSDEDVTTHLVGAIQTDAAINPGNSGGALVDCDGRLVGINTAGATPGEGTGSSGLGFAIPTSLMQRLAAELIESGQVVHPTFGLQVVPLPPDLAAQAGRAPGLLVQVAVPGGPADQAGLRPGDVITEIDGAPVFTLDDLVGAELRAGIGESVSVTFDRDGEQSTVTLEVQALDELAARP
jgi:putative serine protease PepD